MNSPDLSKIEHVSRFEQTRYRKFIVLSRGRTGSYMLYRMLKFHPSVYMQGEIFNRLNGRSEEYILNEIFSSKPNGIEAVGFKIFYDHPFDNRSNKVWEKLQAIKNLHVIHLKRKNILRTLTSRKIAGRTDVWKERIGTEITIRLDDRKVSFTKNELIRGFVKTTEWETKFDVAFGQHRMLNVYYEDIVESTESEIRKISEFLNLEYIPLNADSKRQNPERLSELILNYKDLKQEFRNTRWASYFED